MLNPANLTMIPKAIPMRCTCLRYLLLGVAAGMIAVLSGISPLVAQTSPGCVPQNANSPYPCVYSPSTQTATITVIDSSTNSSLTPIPPGVTPILVAITPDNASVYFAYQSTVSSLGVIHTHSNTVDPSIAISLAAGAFPLSMAMSPDGSQLWVVEENFQASLPLWQIEVIDVATNKVLYAITATQIQAAKLFSVAFSPDSTTAYVACTSVNGTPNPPCVDKLNAKSSLSPFIAQIQLSGQVDSAASIAVSPDGSNVIRTIVDPKQGFGAAFISASDNTIKTAFSGISTQASNYGIGVTLAGTVYVASPNVSSDIQGTDVYVFSLNPQRYVGTIATGSGPNGVAITADGHTAYISTTQGVSAIDTATGAVATISNSGVNLVGIAAMPSLEPAITTQPASQTIDSGQQATLTVVASGTPPLTYQWYQQSGDTSSPVSGATSSTFTTPALKSNTNYWVQVNNVVAGGALNSNSALITVIPPKAPSITLQPASETITAPGSATLTVAASGTAPLTYQWYVGNSGDTTAPVAGATNSSFTTSPGTTTTYWVEVTNSVGNANSNSATVTVLQTAPSITLQPSGPTITAPGSATLTVAASGTPPFSYQWYVGNSGDTTAPVAGATNSSFTTSPSTTTTYWVQITNSVGSANSNSATVTVLHLPTCTLVLQGTGITNSSNFVSAYNVMATANCTDPNPQGLPLTISIDWGDGSPLASGSGQMLQATHSYTSPSGKCDGGQSQPCTYNIALTAVDARELTQKGTFPTTVVTTAAIPPVFSGQVSTFTVYLSLPPNNAPEQVTFTCPTVTESNGTPMPASSLGISCSSIPTIVTLTSNLTAVTIEVKTTGFATARLQRDRRGVSGYFYALCIPAAWMLLLGRRRRRLFTCTGLLLLCLVFVVDCGNGGYKRPATLTGAVETPPGNYQLNIVDQPVNGAGNSGFVQISLIVPLNVSQTQ